MFKQTNKKTPNKIPTHSLKTLVTQSHFVDALLIVFECFIYLVNALLHCKSLLCDKEVSRIHER